MTVFDCSTNDLLSAQRILSLKFIQIALLRSLCGPAKSAVFSFKKKLISSQIELPIRKLSDYFIWLFFLCHKRWLVNGENEHYGDPRAFPDICGRSAGHVADNLQDTSSDSKIDPPDLSLENLESCFKI